MVTQAQLFSFPQPVAPTDIGTMAPPMGDNGSNAPFSVAISDPGVDLARKTVCIKVRLSTMGNTRKVSTSQIEADADKDRKQLVTAFIAAYPSLCQHAAKRLRGLYNPADYPPVEDIAREFGFSWQYVSFGVPDQLKSISREVWEEEREKAAQRMAEASAEIQIVLRESMAKLVQHMADRLKEGPDGKPLRFKESTVSNLVEFLTNFEFRNVTDDKELQALAAQARQILQGVSADDLRTTGDLRVKVQQGMADIAAQLDTMLTRTGGRRFRFDEEES